MKKLDLDFDLVHCCLCGYYVDTVCVGVTGDTTCKICCVRLSKEIKDRLRPYITGWDPGTDDRTAYFLKWGFGSSIYARKIMPDLGGT